MIALAVVRHLSTLGLVDWRETASGGNAFLATMPSTPNKATAVMPAPPSPQRSKAPTDLPSVQVLVRGEPNVVIEPEQRAQAIYDALACLDHVTLDPGGTAEVFVIGCTPVQSGPVWIGKDANQRHEWSLNFDLRTHQPTTHRPALA